MDMERSVEIIRVRELLERGHAYFVAPSTSTPKKYICIDAKAIGRTLPNMPPPFWHEQLNGFTKSKRDYAIWEFTNAIDDGHSNSNLAYILPFIWFRDFSKWTDIEKGWV
jgi:hypothetical protein